MSKICRTYAYLVPSSIGSRSFAIAWYVNSWMKGVSVSIARSVIIIVARGRGGSDDFYSEVRATRMFDKRLSALTGHSGLAFL